jgi:hypothetical protein
VSRTSHSFESPVLRLSPARSTPSDVLVRAPEPARVFVQPIEPCFHPAVKQRLTWMLIGALAAVGLSSTPTHAICNAMYETDASSIIRDALARSDLAFVSTVTSTTYPNQDAESQGEIAFHVEDAWKGDAGKEVTLRFAYSEDGDIERARAGERWLVFAAGGVAFGDCLDASRETDDLATLRPADAHAPSNRPLHNVFVILIIGAAVAILVAAGRRRGSRSIDAPPRSDKA